MVIIPDNETIKYTKEARKERAVQLTNYMHDRYMTEYIAHNGKKCFRTYGARVYFYLLCERLHLVDIGEETAYTAEAFAEGVSLEYVEGDITLSFDLLTREQATAQKNNFNFLEYAYNKQRRAVRITEVTYDKEHNVFLGIWRDDGESWEVMGYYPDTDAVPLADYFEEVVQNETK